ncbi:MAG: hypothetical protein LUD81_10805 [Clostridiales bacterium]|nr:hypothetical protein [Clostridiales bacterium]
MKKNILAIGLAAVILAGCGGSGSEAETTTEATVETTTEIQTETETEAETEAPEEETEAQTEAQVQAAPETEAPVLTAEPQEETPAAEPETPAEEAEEPAPSATKADAEGYIGASVSSLKAAIGAPNSSSYADSCLGAGQDGELHYNGFVVYTYVDENGNETVDSVESE